MNSQNLFKDPNTNWKYILIVAILGFLVGGGILWWLPRQEIEMPEIEIPERKTPEEVEVPADWKTYRNEEYGFEFSYPATWQLREFRVGDEIEYIALDPGEPASQQAFETLDIPLGLMTIDLTLTRALSESPGESKEIITKISEYFTGEQYPNPVYWNKHIIDYYVNLRDGWRISLSYISDLEEKYLEDFYQILSTFRFLE